MAYRCPRCEGPVQRGSSTGALWAAGIVGALFYAAFGSFECKSCGKLRKSEFSPEDRNKMLMGSVGLIVGGVVLLAGVIWLLVALESF